jgi:hypothetical protein
MSLDELKAAVTRLSNDELTAFASWFADYIVAAWDIKIGPLRLDAPRIRANPNIAGGPPKVP